MNRWAFVLATIAALLSMGCTKVVSLQPLYVADDPIPDIDLVGRWAEVEGKSLCAITQTDGGFLLSYLPDNGPAARYRIRPVAVGNSMFLDLTSEDVPDLAVPGHWLAKVERSGGDLLVWPLESEWVENQCTAGHLTCVKVGQSRDGEDLVMTSPPSVLQRALLSPQAFGDPGRFRKLD
jgi:hypothetical protein